MDSAVESFNMKIHALMNDCFTTKTVPKVSSEISQGLQHWLNILLKRGGAQQLLTIRKT